MARRFFYVCAGLAILLFAVAASYSRSNAVVTPSGEVAVITGLVTDGGILPLPIYADGTPAIESECKWIVSPAIVWGLGTSERIVCLTNGRQVQVGGTGLTPPFGNSNTANYMVIATRGATLPTSARASSWGQLKVGDR